MKFKNYKFIANLTNRILIILTIGFIVIIFLLFFKNRNLVKNLNNNLYIQVGDEMYEAERSTINQEQINGLIKLSFSYLFNHDQYSYINNIEIAKDFFDEEDINIIINAFEKSSEKSLLDTYKENNSRMKYIISNIENEDGNYIIKGKRYIFSENNKTLSENYNMQINLKKTQKTDKNLYGIIIYNIQIIK